MNKQGYLSLSDTGENTALVGVNTATDDKEKAIVESISLILNSDGEILNLERWYLKKSKSDRLKSLSIWMLSLAEDLEVLLNTHRDHLTLHHLYRTKEFLVIPELPTLHLIDNCRPALPFLNANAHAWETKTLSHYKITVVKKWLQSIITEIVNVNVYAEFS